MCFTGERFYQLPLRRSKMVDIDSFLLLSVSERKHTWRTHRLFRRLVCFPPIHKWNCLTTSFWKSDLNCSWSYTWMVIKSSHNPTPIDVHHYSSVNIHLISTSQMIATKYWDRSVLWCTYVNLNSGSKTVKHLNWVRDGAKLNTWLKVKDSCHIHPHHLNQRLWSRIDQSKYTIGATFNRTIFSLFIIRV